MSFAEVREVELLAGDYSATETAKGKVIRVPLGELAADRLGMEPHLSFLRIESTVQYDALAAMTENFPGELFYTSIKNVRMEIEEKALIDNVDGWDLYCDHWLRFGEKWETLPADVADPGADSLNQTQALNWLIRFTDPEKPSPYNRDGLIPLRLFDPRAVQKNVFQFEVAGANLAGFSNFNVDDLGATKVWAGIVYQRKVRLPAPGRLFVLSDPAKDIKGIEPSGRLEYLAISDRSNSTPSFINNVYTGYSNIELQIGGQSLYNGRSLAEIVRMLNSRRRRRGVTEISSSGLSEFVAPVYAPRLGALRSELYRGRVRLNIGTRSNHTETRLLIRESGRKDNAWVSRCLKKLGIPESQLAQANLEPIGGPGGKGGELDAELDHAVWHPALGGIAGRKAARGK